MPKKKSDSKPFTSPEVVATLAEKGRVAAQNAIAREQFKLLAARIKEQTITKLAAAAAGAVEPHAMATAVASAAEIVIQNFTLAASTTGSRATASEPSEAQGTALGNVITMPMPNRANAVEVTKGMKVAAGGGSSRQPVFTAPPIPVTDGPIELPAFLSRGALPTGPVSPIPRGDVLKAANNSQGASAGGICPQTPLITSQTSGKAVLPVFVAPSVALDKLEACPSPFGVEPTATASNMPVNAPAPAIMPKAAPGRPLEAAGAPGPPTATPTPTPTPTPSGDAGGRVSTYRVPTKPSPMAALLPTVTRMPASARQTELQAMGGPKLRTLAEHYRAPNGRPLMAYAQAVRAGADAVMRGVLVYEITNGSVTDDLGLVPQELDTATTWGS